MIKYHCRKWDEYLNLYLRHAQEILILAEDVQGHLQQTQCFECEEGTFLARWNQDFGSEKDRIEKRLTTLNRQFLKALSDYTGMLKGIEL